MVAGLGLSILRCLRVHGSRTGLEEFTTLRKSLLPFLKKKKIPKAQHLKLARSPLRGGRFKQAHGSDFWSFGFGVLRCLRVYYGSRAKA